MKEIKFDFKYGEKNFQESIKKTRKTDNGYCFELEDGVIVWQKITRYEKFDAIYSELTFENTADKDSEMISELNDCVDEFFVNEEITEQARKSKFSSFRITKMTGTITGWDYPVDEIKSGTEFNLSDDYLTEPEWTKKNENVRSERYYTNYEGRSSSGIVPIFDLNDEEKGRIIAIGWSGNWKAEFSREDNIVTTKTGLRTGCFVLKSKEKIRTSSVLIMNYNKDESGNNKFRRLLKEFFVPETIKSRNGIVAFESFGNITSEEMCNRVNAVAESGIEFDYHWVDAGWYGYEDIDKEKRNANWNNYIGDYVVDKNNHPDDFAEVTKCEEKNNMPLKLWVEIERYDNQSRLVKKHPEWFMKQSENYSVIDLGNELACQYTIDLLCGLVDKLKIGGFKLDFNCDPTECWYRENEQRGDREIRYINGLYKVWDALLQRYPGFVLDTCATGGKRFDIEAIRRSINLCRSDYVCLLNADADVIQAHNSLSHYIPYVGCFARVINDEYHFRSCYCSCLGASYNSFEYQKLTKDDLNWLTKMHKEYKMLQEYFCSDYYSLGATGYDKTSWVVWQYDRPEKRDGLIMAFRREKASCKKANFELKQIISNAIYSFKNIDNEQIIQYSDEQLKKFGLEITLENSRSSVIFKYNY